MDCGAEVAPTLNSIVRGKSSGCRYCGRQRARAAALASEAPRAHADLDAAGREPLEDYRGANWPWKSRCRQCGTVSSPTISNLRKGHRCQICAARKVSKDSRLRERERAVADMRAAGWEPLTDYPGSVHPWPSRCLRCGRESAPRLGNVRRGSGCRHCASNVAVTAEEALAAFRARALEPVDPIFPGTKRGWRSRCLRCGNEVSPKLAHLRSGASKGCRYCSGLGPTNPVVAVVNMRAVGLEPQEAFPGYNVPWRCICMRCNRPVSPRYGNVIARNRGCSYCAGGPDRNAPALVYVIVHQDHQALKVGVTSIEAQTDRVAAHHRRGWEPFQALTTTTGDIAYRIEAEVISYLAYDLGLEPYLGPEHMPQGGATETFSLDSVTASEMWELVRTFAQQLGAETTPAVQRPLRRGRARNFNVEQAIATMRKAGVEPLVLYPGSNQPWECHCTQCGKLVYPRYNSVQKGIGGCKLCGDVRRGLAQRVSDEDAAAELRAAGREPLEPYPGNVRTPWKSKCDQCGKEGSPCLSRVRSAGRCCRPCSFAVARQSRESRSRANRSPRSAD
jgi:hypothetical protein